MITYTALTLQNRAEGVVCSDERVQSQHDRAQAKTTLPDSPGSRCSPPKTWTLEPESIPRCFLYTSLLPDERSHCE